MIDDKSMLKYVTSKFEDKGGRVRWNAVSVLGKIGDDEVLEDIKPMLEDEDLRVKHTAAEAIQKIQDRVISRNAPVNSGIEEKDSDANEYALYHLLEYGEKGISECHHDIFKSEYEYWITGSSYVIYLPWELKNFDVTKFLEKETEVLRSFALFILAYRGDEKALHHAIPKLDDKSDTVRRYALYVTGILGDNGALQYIIPKLKDKNKEVRSVTKHVLFWLSKRIDFQPFVLYFDPSHPDKEKGIRAFINDYHSEEVTKDPYITSFFVEEMKKDGNYWASYIRFRLVQKPELSLPLNELLSRIESS